MHPIKFAFATFALSAVFQLSAADAFKDVESRLDKGGAVYLQLDGRESFQPVGAKLEALGGLFQQLPGAKRPVGGQDFGKIFRVLAAAYRASGFAEVDAYGFSSVKRDDGLFTHKGVLRCPSDKATGFVWKAFGREPSDIGKSISMLPPSTSFVYFSDFDAKAFRCAVKAALSDEHAPSALRRLERAEADAKANGFDIDAILDSYDGQFAIAFTLDQAVKFPIPVPNIGGGMPTIIQMPTPGVLLMMKVKDDTFFNAIAAKSPDMKPADRAGARVIEGVNLQGTPLALQITIARKGHWLLLASSPQLADATFAALDGGPSLAGTDSFKRLSKGVGLEGNAFVYYDNSLLALIKSFEPAFARNEMFKAIPQIAELVGLDNEVFNVARQDSKSLLTWTGNANSAGVPSSNPLQALAPLLITSSMAGIMTPAVSNDSRGKAERIGGASSLKQIGLAIKQYALDHSDVFPEKSGAEGLELLRVGDYLTDTSLFVNGNNRTKKAQEGRPLSEDTVSYVYLGGFKESDSPEIPIAFDKPGQWDGYVNVLFIDGHVQGFPLRYGSAIEFARNYIEKYGRNMPADARQSFLERALLYDMSQGQ